jgi:hypothetical protein
LLVRSTKMEVENTNSIPELLNRIKSLNYNDRVRACATTASKADQEFRKNLISKLIPVQKV